MIPAHYVSQRQVGILMEYLRDEISRAEMERRPLEESWLKFERAYRAIPETEIREFPFLGAANFVVPMIATDVDTLFSRIMGLLFTAENLWTCKALQPDFMEIAPRLQEFLAWAQKNELNAYNAIADWTLEICKQGTGVLKQRYRREQKRVYQFRETPDGQLEQVLNILLHDHPQLDHVSLWDFLVPSSAVDHQEAPWCAERVGLTWGQLQNRARAGVYQIPPNIGAWRANDQGSTITTELQRLDGASPAFSDKFYSWETWLDFDISGAGEPMSLVCTIHIPTMSYWRIDFNPFFNQDRPYSVARFLRQSKRFYGIGLGEMIFPMQDEVTTTHRQRVDNRTLANSVMMKARKGIGIRQDEPIFPGRWFLLDDMADVEPINMGRNFDSSIQDETLTMQIGARRTGVNDYIMGSMEPSINYGTATMGVQQYQTAAKRFDQTLREIHNALAESGTRVLEMYQQFNQHGKEYLVMGAQEGQMLHQILQFPLDLIRKGIGVELTASSAAFNKEVEIRTNTLMMQMLMQFYNQMIQAAAYVVNPQVPPQIQSMAMHMIEGGSTLMRRILDNYGTQDVDALVPRMQELMNGGQQQLGSIQAALGGAANGGAGLNGPSGMAALPPGAGGAQTAMPLLIGAGR